MGVHFVGYVSKANEKEMQQDKKTKLLKKVGKSGLEKQYNDYLNGTLGERVYKVNAYNEVIEELEYTKPGENNSIVLHIDMKLQKYISELFEGKAGAVVVMRTDGALLALGSYPEYDPNLFVEGISYKKWNAIIKDLKKPFTNKAINGLYPPGSTIKPALGLVFLSTKLDKRFFVECTGSMDLGERKFRCWKEKGHHKTHIRKAIRESCDDFFYKGSMKVGIRAMSEGLKRYGLGVKTGIDLPYEFIGTVPGRQWKQERYNKPWYLGETLNTSIGQGDFLSTPLQVSVMTALLASGKLPVPQLLKTIDGKENVLIQQEILNKKEKKHLPLIQSAMRDVVSHDRGTAKWYLLGTKTEVAAKTGTAQVVGIAQDIKKRAEESDLEYLRRSQAWLTTFAPYKDPKYVVTVLVEHGGHGGAAAGPIVKAIYNKMVELGYFENN